MQSQHRQPPAGDKTPAAVSLRAPDTPQPLAIDPLPAAANAVDRVLLLASHGPLIVDMRVTVDGHPLREPREELIGELLQLADRDHDGRPTWGEVFADPRRIFGLLRTDALHLAHRRDFMKANDTNHNGLVDRDEARRFIAAVKSAGASLSIQNAADFYASAARQSIVRKLLDADGDGALDRGERMALGQRLLSRDANNDRIVTWPELDDSLAGDEVADDRQKSRRHNQPAALSLWPSANWHEIEDAIQRNYLNDEPAVSDSSWLPRLDADGDRRLSAKELRGLDSLAPDAAIGVAFQESEERLARRLTLETLSPRLTRIGVPAAEQISLGSRSPSLRLRFVLDDRRAGDGRWSSAETQLAALDANKDGHLEPNEAAAAFDLKTFGGIDANADGKIQSAELIAYWKSPRARGLAGVYAIVLCEQDAVFSLLDTNHDGRLTTRELGGGSLALDDCDADGDGRVTIDEIPEAFVIVLGRGRPPEQPLLAGTFTPGGGAGPAPEWFQYMDANGDMEVDRDEFPGGSGRFRALDLDHDGFITREEARQAVSDSRR